MDNLLENIPITEAYIGKTDNLKEIEHQFELLKSKASKFKDLNSCDEVKTINRLVEKQFGMDTFSLRIVNKDYLGGRTLVVAAAFDVGLRQDFDKLVEGSMSKGFNFKKNNDLCIIVEITIGILKSDLTGEELTAVILHEIGHNFGNFIDNDVILANRSWIKYNLQLAVLYGSINYGAQYDKVKNQIDKRISRSTTEYAKKEAEDLEKPNKLRGILKGISSLKFNFERFCTVVARNFINKTKQPGTRDVDLESEKVEKYHNMIKRSSGRKDEVFADKFAAIYGYSVPLATGLEKCEGDDHEPGGKFMAKLFGDDALIGFEDINKYFFIVNEHPHLIQRITTMRHSLTTELENEDLDPKVKKIIKAQLDDLDKYLKEITTVYKDESKRQQLRKAFYKTVSEKCPEALTKKLEDEIEDEMNKALSK